ncbi:MAG: phosphatidylserine decarboxylase [Elusimicrobia bacterium]|nr:phosphatidylserine decarboxylase [Elusimicrobiota bacterium]
MRIPIAADGWRFIIGFAVLGAFLLWLGRWWSMPWGVVAILLTCFCAYFFRDFDRATPLNDALIYAPGDGRVLDVSKVDAGPYAGRPIVRIFLSVFDVHVQRTPVGGKVSRVEYKKGTFLDARHERAHLDNEQNLVTIDSPRGPIVVNQIAGLIARRILCWVKHGDAVQQGQRYGLIRFGSQVDVIFPTTGVSIEVKPGERVVSGVTVLAKWVS